MSATGSDALELGDKQERLNPDGSEGNPISSNKVAIYVTYLGIALHYPSKGSKLLTTAPRCHFGKL